MRKLTVLLLVCLASRAIAGGYGRGKPHRIGLYSPDEYYHNHMPAANLLRDQDVPKEFNWCAHDGVNYCTASWNQHIPKYCGSCWAHGTLSMIQDRLKVAKLRAGDLAPDVMLGRQTLLNCAGFKGLGDGCNGGEPLEVFKYMTEYGLPDESCLHYAATDHHVFKKQGYKDCPSKGRCMNCMPTGDDVDDYKCWAIKRPIMYKLTAYGKLEAGEEAMKQEILARGPIVCGIACPDDFTYHYHSSKNGGVYVDKSGDTELDHDIEVVGWGEENGMKYWLARNSWGTYWGELGFFKVQRGVNALQIESGDCWYAVPEYGLESAVTEGDWEGSMYGLKDRKHKHHEDDDDDDDGDDAHDEQPDHYDDEDEEDEEDVEPSTAAVILPADVIPDADLQAAQIMAALSDIAADEESISSNGNDDHEVSDAESVVMVMQGPIILGSPATIWGGVRHACQGMRQAAGVAVQQLWNAVMQGSSGPWGMQQGYDQQQQDSVAYGGRAGMMGRMMGVEGDAEDRVAVQ